jgi:hypothetical protein
MDDDDYFSRYFVTVERRFEVMLVPGTREVCGACLAEKLILEALRLLCAEQLQNIGKAREELLILTEQAEQILEAECEAGEKPGLVLTVPSAMN